MSCNKLMDPILSERGQSLVQALVAVGIMGIAAMAMATLFENLQRENRALRQSLAVLDTQAYAQKTLADGTVCSYQLTVSPHTFDSTAVGTSTPPVFQLQSILTKADPAAQPAISVNDSPSAVDPNLKVSKIEINNLSAAGPDVYKADVVIYFNPSGLIRQLRPVVISTLLNTVSSGTSRTITSCQTDGALRGCIPRTVTNQSGYVSEAIANCDAGEKLMGGSGGCESADGRMSVNKSFPDNNAWKTQCVYEQNGWGNNGWYVHSTATATAFCCK